MTDNPHPSFSLRDEARNTERHHSWNSDLKLRHTQINFVSAGDVETSSRASPTSIQDHNTSAGQGTVKEKIPEKAMAGMNLYAQVSEDRSSTHDSFASTVRNSSPGNYRSTATGGGPPSGNNENVLIIDTEGFPDPIATGLPAPELRLSLSLTASDSSEEVIIFAGRNRSPMNLGNKRFSSAHKSNSSISTTPKMTESSVIHAVPRDCKPEISILSVSASDISTYESQPKARTVEPHATTLQLQTPTLVNGARRKASQRSRQRLQRGAASIRRRLEEEPFADYIANIDDSDTLRGFNTKPGLKGYGDHDQDSDEWQDETGESATERQIDAMLEGVVGWSATDLQDLDELSTSDELLEAIEHILSKRERASGIQYLVVWKGYTVDDARWIPLTSLKMPGADKKIRLFEAEEKLVDQHVSSYDTSDESVAEEDQLVMDLDEDLEDLKDEEGLLERQKARLTDEQIARLLSKQEELGFGSDELMLFDGGEGKQGDGQDIPEARRASAIASNLRVKAKNKNRPLRGFPSATALADVLDQDPYNGFDIMDHERPSLRKKPKGRRGVLPFELSDSDLETSIKPAWQQDRSKKRMRKQEREELRAQGLLGKKDKVDMKAKYAEGMSLDEIKREIRDFLITPIET